LIYPLKELGEVAINRENEEMRRGRGFFILEKNEIKVSILKARGKSRKSSW
jgi:ribosomal protein L13E